MRACFEHRRSGKVCPVVGVMSGTSLDGFDICLVTISGAGLAGLVLHEIIDFVTVPIEPSLRRDIQLLMSAEDDDKVTLPDCSTAKNRSCVAANTSQLMCRVNMDWSRLVGKSINEVLSRNASRIDATAVVVASHGQTIWHEVGHSTLQIGDGETLAQITQCPVVCNFRCADVAVGGQGAPLVPYFDLVLAYMITRPLAAAALHDGKLPSFLLQLEPSDIAFQNLGGIGNVCIVVDASSSPDAGRKGERGLLSATTEVCAFDTGPANVVLNELIEQAAAAVGPESWEAFLIEHHVLDSVPFCTDPDQFEAMGSPSSPPAPRDLRCDWNGALSSKGEVVPFLLQNWLDMHKDFIQAAPPKSTGRERFGHDFVAKEVLSYVLVGEDEAGKWSICGHKFFHICRTIIALTAETIAQSYKCFLPRWPRVVALSGGGALNRTMRLEIQLALDRALPSASSQRCVVVAASSLISAFSCGGFGMNGFSFDDAKEALAFAVLGHERMNYFAGVTEAGTNVVSATGASRCVSLGQVSLPMAPRLQ